MVNVVPLIRTAAVFPLIRWLQAKRHPVETLLSEVDLAASPSNNPMQPIPLVSVASLLRLAGRLEGPDVSCRIVSETSVLELLLLGKVALGTQTPREALTRIAVALPYFCTHEHLTVDPDRDGVIVREFFAMKFDADTLHLIHQYAAAMMKALCGMAGAGDPLLARIEIAPHPEFGLDHLHRWFGDSVIVPTMRRTLNVFIEKNVVDRPFRTRARDRMAGRLPHGLIPLRGDGTFAGSARIVIAAMLDGGTPSVERLSAVAGTSVRTLQRRLDAEGTSFSALLDDVRRSQALERLAEGNQSVGAVSAQLSYTRQASFTRAVRRWTGSSPSHLRSRGPR
jgi:AraC-like DNA-binding protein